MPHFEKMLYDNALLLRVYAHLWRLTGDALARRVAVRDGRVPAAPICVPPEGGFASSLDADTNGVEGLTYCLDSGTADRGARPEDGPWAADLFGVTEAGTFEHGTSVLRLARDIDDADDAVQASAGSTVKAVLSIKRATRPQPGRDDKVIAEWNGLAITALAEFHEIAVGHRVVRRRTPVTGRRRGRGPGWCVPTWSKGRLRRASRARCRR